VAREQGLKVDFRILLLGGRKIESKVGFSIRSDPDGGVTIEGDGYDVVPLVTFYLSGLSNVSYVVVQVVKSIPLKI
jgi:hypothetical protein